MKRSFYRRYGKPFFDFAVALLILIIFAPLLLLLVLLVRCLLGRPVFFRQQRPGWKTRPFFILKFRTMTTARASDGGLLPDAERLTRFGRFLRSTSLDELPEFLNVLRGEMSLVGPRPLLLQYLPRYTTEQMRRHEVLPGITGWAQIAGRNRLDWNDRFAADVWYIDHLSFILDLRILLLTMKRVVMREGISAEGHATIAEFKGNKH